VNWGEEGVCPNKLWGFLSLENCRMPERLLHHGGIQLEHEIYAVVEHSTYEDKKRENSLTSDMFTPILKEVGGWVGENVSRYKFYLAPVESIHSPVVVIPDEDGPANRYFTLSSRDEWAHFFERWLEAPHES